MQIAPGSARASNRAAMLTPSPSRLSPSTMTSPTWTPELHRLVSGAARILCSYRGLHRNRALDGIDRAGEIGGDAVPGGIENAAVVRRDQSVDDGAAPLQPGERADFVARHQPAVAGNVGGENRGEFAFDRLDGHAWLLSTKYSKPHNRRVSFQAQIVAAQSHET